MFHAKHYDLGLKEKENGEATAELEGHNENGKVDFLEQRQENTADVDREKEKEKEKDTERGGEEEEKEKEAEAEKDEGNWANHWEGQTIKRSRANTAKFQLGTGSHRSTFRQTVQVATSVTTAPSIPPTISLSTSQRADLDPSELFEHQRKLGEGYKFFFFPHSVALIIFLF